MIRFKTEKKKKKKTLRTPGVHFKTIYIWHNKLP